MIDTLQSFASVRPDEALPSIKKLIYQRSLMFTYILSPLVDE